MPPVKLNIEEYAKFIPNTFYPNKKIAVSHTSYAVVKGAEIVATVESPWQGSVPSSFLDLVTLQY